MLVYLGGNNFNFIDDRRGLQTMTIDKAPSYDDLSVNVQTGKSRMYGDGCGLGDGGSLYSEARTYRLYPHLDSTTGSGKGDANEHVTRYADCGDGKPILAGGLK